MTTININCYAQAFCTSILIVTDTYTPYAISLTTPNRQSIYHRHPQTTNERNEIDHCLLNLKEIMKLTFSLILTFTSNIRNL